MGIAERREREKEQRRNDIVDAAECVFFERGWETSTMDDVAEAAELAKATLYLYFKSKESLYMAILLRGSHILLKLFQEAAARGSTGMERVVGIGRAYVQFFEAHRDYFDAMIYFDSTGAKAEEDCDEICQACLECDEKVMALLTGSVREGMADGTIRDGIDPDEIAILLWAQTSGVLQLITRQRTALEQYYDVKADKLLESHFTFVDQALSPVGNS